MMPTLIQGHMTLEQLIVSVRILLCGKDQRWKTNLFEVVSAFHQPPRSDRLGALLAFSSSDH